MDPLEKISGPKKISQLSKNLIAPLLMNLAEAFASEFSAEKLDACQAKTWQLMNDLKKIVSCNTMCAFREKSEPDVRLRENDIFFLDLDPIYDGYEGDCGKTFVIGDFKDGEEIIRTSEEVFSLVSARFKETKQSGAELYTYAESLCE